MRVGGEVRAELLLRESRRWWIVGGGLGEGDEWLDRGRDILLDRIPGIVSDNFISRYIIAILIRDFTFVGGYVGIFTLDFLSTQNSPRSDE